MAQRNRKLVIAALLSFLQPGLGFAYNDFYKTALLIAIIPTSFEIIFSVSGVFRSFAWLAFVFAFEVAARLFSFMFNLEYAKGLSNRKVNKVLRRFLYAGIILISAAGGFSKTISPVQNFDVSSGAMESAILKGEYIMIDKAYYKRNPIAVGDVVAFYPRRTVYGGDTTYPFLMRIVALEGQEVEIRNGLTYVDGRRSLPSLMIKRLTPEIRPADFHDQKIYPAGAENCDQYGPFVVPADSFFILGDLRDDAIDSRYFGCVGRKAIIGKALYIYWSGDWSRIGKRVE